MKTSIKILSTILLASVFTLESCVKKPETAPEETPETPTTTGGGSAPAPIVSSPSDANGVCVASKINVTTAVPNTTFVVTVTMGSATGSFYSTAGSGTLDDAGTVKTNDSTHTKQSNNAYVFSPKSATGINFTSNSRWNITGNGSIPAITYTANGFPSSPTVSNVTSVSKGSAFTLSTASISNADSLCYQITAGSKSIYKITAASQTSYTFPASEMGTLDVTDYGYATVTAYKFNNTTVSSKKIYFINLNTANRSIKVTN
ncbi:MAG: hypothetical protein IPL10_10155 [Bacteroidetes bacterium]|jgi:hypothetical protein|nr:hypothetical protein [Bacteroidota bacterium]